MLSKSKLAGEAVASILLAEEYTAMLKPREAAAVFGLSIPHCIKVNFPAGKGQSTQLLIENFIVLVITDIEQLWSFVFSIPLLSS